MTRLRPLVVAAACLLPHAAGAQSGAVRVGLGSAQVERISPVNGTQAFDGMGFALDGAFGLGPVTLGVRYFDGGISSDEVATEIDLVEGEALLWATPVRWVSVGLGPHIRAYVEEGGTERWVMWELRARGSVDLLRPALGAYIEGWTVLSADADVAETFDSGRGFEGGLSVAAGRLPFSARLRYRVERLELGDGVRRETVEHIGVVIGVGRR
jgi:hypothetical protein